VVVLVVAVGQSVGQLHLFSCGPHIPFPHFVQKNFVPLLIEHLSPSGVDIDICFNPRQQAGFISHSSVPPSGTHAPQSFGQLHLFSNGPHIPFPHFVHEPVSVIIEHSGPFWIMAVICVNPGQHGFV